MLYVGFLTIYEYTVLDTRTIAAITSLNHTQVVGDLKVVRAVTWFEPLVVIPILCFAYQTHEIIVPVYACMKQRNLYEFLKTTVVSLAILFLVYNVVGTFGYLTFGINVAPDIMSSYDAQDPVVVIGIIALVVKFITTYPQLLFCGRGALEGLYGEIKQLNVAEFEANEKSRRIIITTLWFLTTVALAIFAPDISITLQLLGSMASINVFVFPGMCLITLTGQLRRNNNWLRENHTSMQKLKHNCLYAGLYLFAALLILVGFFVFVLELAFVFYL